MKNYGNNDTVFARALMMGQELLNVRISGVSSQESLMEAVRSQMGTHLGSLVSLSIRNLTQGWAVTQPYCYIR